jgi:hypothetical protein
MDVELDGTGRVLISPELRQAAGLTREAMLLGMGRHFELWDKATYDEPRRPRPCRPGNARVVRGLHLLEGGGAVNAWSHTTVLLNEAVDALVTDPRGQYVDATFGRGGHARLILRRLAPEGRLIAFDKDPEALAEAARIQDARLFDPPPGFPALGDLPPRSAAGVLMDLGISSPQIDNPARGFSFRADGPLDMRMDPRAARARPSGWQQPRFSGRSQR